MSRVRVESRASSRPRRVTRHLAAVAVAGLAVTGVPTGAGAETGRAVVDRDGESSLSVTGYALDSASDPLVRRNAGGLDTLTVVGVSLSPGGHRVGGVPRATRRLLSTAHANGLRAELLVNNFSNRLGDFDRTAVDRLLTSPARIDRISTALSRQVRTQGWDGLNVDLEALRRRDGQGLVSLLRQLRARLPAGTSLSIDVSARTSRRAYRDGGYRLTQIARTVDVVQLMTYDQHGPTWSGQGPVGGLPWQRRSLAVALTEVPARQLDLGVAGYGYTWPARRTGRTGRTLTVAQARRAVRRDGARARWDARQGEWHARLSDGTRIWWSDARSYAVRRRLAAQHDLHGLAVWRIGSADRL